MTLDMRIALRVFGLGVRAIVAAIREVNQNVPLITREARGRPEDHLNLMQEGIDQPDPVGGPR